MALSGRYEPFNTCLANRRSEVSRPSRNFAWMACRVRHAALLSPERLFGNGKAGRGSQRPRQARLPVRQFERTEKILPANRKSLAVAEGQFAPDTTQFRSVPLDLAKVDLRSFENSQSLPGTTGDGRTSCKLCLQDPIEDPIPRGGQLLQTAIERRRSSYRPRPA